MRESDSGRVVEQLQGELARLHKRLAPLYHLPMPLTDKEVSTYLVFRIKTNELIHLHMLWLAIKDGQCGESIFGIDNQIVRETLRTVAMAWFSTIVDKNGLNIFPVWEKMFPQYKKRITLYRAAIQPELICCGHSVTGQRFMQSQYFPSFLLPESICMTT
jgi:hypothetical protein